MYRPEGFEEYLKRHCGVVVPADAKLINIGADAMLEGLWEMAKESPTGVLIIDSNLMEIYARILDLSGEGE